ncbi:hypothetical protein ACP4OV_016241 [Aristida adscensionis]
MDLGTLQPLSCPRPSRSGGGGVAIHPDSGDSCGRQAAAVAACHSLSGARLLSSVDEAAVWPSRWVGEREHGVEPIV